LTDGMPNMNPARGYKPTLEGFKDKHFSQRLMPSVTTFGFGKSLDTELLVNLADWTGGRFVYIPDQGFIGTGLTHALANKLQTVTNHASVTVSIRDDLNVKFNYNDPKIRNYKNVTLKYGETTPIVLAIDYRGENRENLVNSDVIRVEIGKKVKNFSVDVENRSEKTDLEDLRSFVVEMLKKLKSMRASGVDKKRVRDVFDQKVQIFRARVNGLTGEVKEQAQGLLKDLIGEDEKDGQVEESFDIQGKMSTGYFEDWGKHFIPSMIHAHQYRECNNFADPGVQNYGSPSFKTIRDKLNDIYDDLPPPKQSHKHRMGQNARQITNMRAYNFSGGCFSGNSFVKNVHGKNIFVENLKKGDLVECPISGKTTEILCLIAMPKLKSRKMIVFKETGLEITPFHPVKFGGEWVFPNDLVDDVSVVEEFTDDVVYNVLTTGSSLSVNGVVACTEKVKKLAKG